MPVKFHGGGAVPVKFHGGGLCRLNFVHFLGSIEYCVMELSKGFIGDYWYLLWANEVLLSI